MGERKGTNKYYPPDYDPSVGSLNKFLGTHALRERARKVHLGIIIVRFEMPFNIWCGGCNQHIGMGVRYNAEKTKIGMYYSTPVYQFRMKCHLCDNHFEIKTDPGNLTYEIVTGATRQESRWNPEENEQILVDKVVSRRLYDDAMYKMEHVQSDTMKMSQSKMSLSKLMAKKEELWKDDYASGYKLRQRYREQRNLEKIQNEKDAAVSKLINIPLLPKSSSDKRIASILMSRRKNSKNVARGKTDIVKRLAVIKNRKTLPNAATKKLNSQLLGVKIKPSVDDEQRPLSLVTADYGSSSSSSD